MAEITLKEVAEKLGYTDMAAFRKEWASLSTVERAELKKLAAADAH